MPVGCGIILALRGTGERGHGTIPEFDPAVLQPSLTHASDGPHRVKGSKGVKGSVLDIGYSPPSFRRRYKRWFR